MLEYSPLDSELKKQTSIAEKIYQKKQKDIDIKFSENIKQGFKITIS